MKIQETKLNELKNIAREACAHAYSPYSGFKVGAAILTEKGNIFGGCNVENASYGLTVCAERSAIFKAVSDEGACRITCVVIYTATAKLSTPCGACRQVINEFANEAEIYCFCDGKDVLVAKIGELLPSPFAAKNIKSI
jgi:cytidine deaminase